MSRPLQRRTPSTLSPGWVGRTLAAAADTAGWSEQLLPADDWLPQRTSSCPVMIPTKSWSCPDSDLEAEVHTHTQHFDLQIISSTQCTALTCQTVRLSIWNRVRPRVHGQNQHARELIGHQKTSHKHNNKDLSHIR